MKWWKWVLCFVALLLLVLLGGFYAFSLAIDGCFWEEHCR